MEQLADGAEKVYGAGVRMYIAIKDLLEGHVVAIVAFGVIRVLVDDVAVQINTGEDTLIARVGEEASVGEDAG